MLISTRLPIRIVGSSTPKYEENGSPNDVLLCWWKAIERPHLTSSAMNKGITWDTYYYEKW